jgi:hypothetical protein
MKIRSVFFLLQSHNSDANHYLISHLVDRVCTLQQCFGSLNKTVLSKSQWQDFRQKFRYTVIRFNFNCNILPVWFCSGTPITKQLATSIIYVLSAAVGMAVSYAVTMYSVLNLRIYRAIFTSESQSTSLQIHSVRI